ncbi:MAG: PQQ-binding-like beta-propeller repeat protein [Solirubrobacterales bacterium]
MAGRGFNRLLFWKKEALSPARAKTMRARLESLWNDHRWATIGTAAGIGAALIALVAYLILKRPPDKSCPAPCTITTQAQQPVSGTTDWPLYRLNPERTGYLDAPGVKPPFSIRWRFKAGHLLEYSPTLVGGQLFGINNSGLAFSIKTRTGKARWKQQIARLNASAPAYSDGNLYYSNLEPGQVVALAGYDGHQIWKHPLPGRTESSPLVVGKRVYVGCECNTVYALDKATGQTVWERHVAGAVKAAPAYSNGIIYVGDYGGELSAIRASDGSIKWQTGSQGTSFGRTGQFYATAAVAFGRVYVGNTDGRMYSFDQQTGKLLWSHSTSNYVYAGAVAAQTADTPPTVYFGSYDGTFYALDARTGDERWTQPDLGSISGAASLIGDTVYVADLKTTSTYGFEASNGDKVFQYTDGAYNPVISDGKQLYLTGYKTLYAFKPRQGQATNGIIEKAPKPAPAPPKKAKKKGKK